MPRPISKRDCLKAMRTAVGVDFMTDTEARELFTEMQRLAEARARARAISLREALTEIAGELKGREKTMAAIDKRNRLLTLFALRSNEDFIKQFPNWGEGLESLFNGSTRKGIGGARQGIFQKERFLSKAWSDRLNAKIEKGGASRAWHKHEHESDVFRALHALQNKTPDDLPQNKEAVVIAQAIFETQSEMLATMNRYGAWIEMQPGYGMMQTHNSMRLVRDGKTGVFSKPDKQLARKEWVQFVKTLNWDKERTFAGRDEDTFFRMVHDNLWSGVHEKGDGREWDVDKWTGTHGSLAAKVSQSRVLWFNDWQSQLAYHQRYGMGDYVQVMEMMIQRSARNTALMQTFGPNWRQTLKQLKDNLVKQARDTDQAVDHIRELERPRFNHYEKLLSGESNGQRPTLWSQAASALSAFTILTKGGSIVVTSFGDVGPMTHRMTSMGMGQLDAHVGLIKSKLPGQSAERREVLQAMYAAHTGMIHGVAARWGYDPKSNQPLSGAAQTSLRLSGFNAFNQSNERAMAMAAASIWGQNAHKPFDKLPSSLRDVFTGYGLTGSEWDAVRTHGTWAFADGKRQKLLKDIGVSQEVLDMENFPNAPRYITTDSVDDIPDEAIGALVTESGLNDTAPNRLRKRDELKWKLGTFSSDQTDIALNVPNLRIKYWTGKTLEQGTPWRMVADLMTIFKGYPITLTHNLWREATRGAGVRGLAEYVTKPSNLFRMAQLIGYAGMAGYVANTIRDLLSGKTPQELIGEDGNLNWAVWSKAMVRGGGAGIMGDLLLTEYDRQYRAFSSILVGPVLSQIDPLASAFTASRDALLEGDEKRARDMRSTLVTTAMNNIPYASMWYLRPILNYFVWYNIREAVSPGVMKRSKAALERQGYQEFFIDPSRVANIPITEPGRKFESLVDQTFR